MALVIDLDLVYQSARRDIQNECVKNYLLRLQINKSGGSLFVFLYSVAIALMNKKNFKSKILWSELPNYINKLVKIMKIKWRFEGDGCLEYQICEFPQSSIEMNNYSDFENFQDLLGIIRDRTWERCIIENIMKHKLVAEECIQDCFNLLTMNMKKKVKIVLLCINQYPLFRDIVAYTFLHCLINL